jgi:hypothetical protein
VVRERKLSCPSAQLVDVRHVSSTDAVSGAACEPCRHAQRRPLAPTRNKVMCRAPPRRAAGVIALHSRGRARVCWRKRDVQSTRQGQRAGRRRGAHNGHRSLRCATSDKCALAHATPARGAGVAGGGRPCQSVRAAWRSRTAAAATGAASRMRCRTLSSGTCHVAECTVCGGTRHDGGAQTRRVRGVGVGWAAPAPPSAARRATAMAARARLFRAPADAGAAGVSRRRVLQQKHAPPATGGGTTRTRTRTPGLHALWMGALAG